MTLVSKSIKSLPKAHLPCHKKGDWTRHNDDDGFQIKSSSLMTWTWATISCHPATNIFYSRIIHWARVLLMHDQSQGGCSDEGDLRPWLWVTLVKQTCVYSPKLRFWSKRSEQTLIWFYCERSEPRQSDFANRNSFDCNVSEPQFDSFLVVCCLADWLEFNFQYFAQVCLTQIFVTLY